MEFNTIMYVLAAAVCAGLVAFATTPPVRALAYYIGAIDVPLDKRRMHKKPTPLIGGLAIYFGFTLASALFCDYTGNLVAIWIGGTVLVIVGILDDKYRLSALLKLFIQIGVALIAVFVCDVSISYITLFGKSIVLGMWEVPVTVLWIVALTNAINLIDGLDGLACGISAICSASISCVMLLAGDYTSAMLTLILTASCIGFIPFNRNPARIFMGDTGALFLGYSLSIISVGGLFKVHTAISFLLPLIVFALPLFDTFNAIIRRVLSGRSPFSPDKGHLHHKLVAMGFTQKESVKILYAICALMGLVSVVFTETMFNKTRTVKAIVLLAAALIILYVNYIVMKNPASRLHSGLFEDEKKTAYRKLKRKVEIATILADRMDDSVGNTENTNEGESGKNE
ncbi:MAG: undecaprenyl/decaprenyl-phosphate alpha-N-acetylglucosaminyl 1-phosphate transferase [Ruminococcaceae bacterium]|nr:undecaprenyl/decaprenyl-phosphate alpha-N-acetylglucosaminyl 1-phosphate transferase [Oscillospiraceae bacterium]